MKTVGRILCGLAFTMMLIGIFASGGCGTVSPEVAGGILDDALATYAEWDESRNQQVAPPPVVTNSGASSSEQDTGHAGVITTPEAVTDGATPSRSPSDFNGLKFRNSADCRDWKITVNVSDVSFRGGNIVWREADGSRAGWNQKSSGGKTINGECILLIPSTGAAGMFDYLRVGQREKILSNLKPSHEGPGFFPGWVPKKGERVGFCIATISRDRNAAKMRERSNVVWFTWPRDGI